MKAEGCLAGDAAALGSTLGLEKAHPAGWGWKECAGDAVKIPLCSWGLPVYAHGQRILGIFFGGPYSAPLAACSWLLHANTAAAPFPGCSRVIIKAALVHCSGPGFEVMIELLKSFL